MKKLEKESKELLRLEFIKLYDKSRLTQLEFATKVGCTIQHISNMKTGSSAVTFKTLFKYSHVFNKVLSITFRKILY